MELAGQKNDYIYKKSCYESNVGLCDTQTLLPFYKTNNKYVGHLTSLKLFSLILQL